MDKSEYLEKYKKKIEYLNFDEEITKLFNESYEISCNNKLEDFNVQLEYEFILRLIKLAKNQNHDIYEALSIYFEKYNEFYLRKRKKDIVNISHEKQKENYDEAFEFTVKNYEEGQLFYKELVQNINLAYKNQLHKKGALDMKYDITIKSIYELFSKYDKSIVEMVLGVLKKTEPISFSILTKKYGENYDTLNENIIFNRKESALYGTFKSYVREKIKTGNMTIRTKKVSFFDWFYEENMSDKEKEEVKIFVSEFLDKNKESQAYKLVVRKYGENYDILNRNMIFTKQESILYENFKASIKRKLKNKSNLKLNSSKIKHSYIKKVKEEKEVVESQEPKIIPSALDYTDTIIYKLTELKYSLGKISLLLNVDTDFILKSYISNLDYYSLSFVINTIMEYNPKYLINIFSSNYFDELLNILSPIEKQLIYYLILAKNNMISLDEISTIMNISVEDITNYQIYTREEKYDELNNYISFNNEKKKVLTSKM